MKLDKKVFWAQIALFAASLLWGFSFLIVKSTLDVFPPNLLIALRYSIACAILCIVFRKRLAHLRASAIKAGIVIGIVLFLATFIQTTALQYTTPGKNAFLTGIYCVIVPFMFWMFSKERPDRFHIIAACICIVGIGFVSLDGDFNITLGDGLSLLGGVFFAGHIVAISLLTQKNDPVLLTIVQFGAAGVLGWFFSLFSGSIGALQLTLPSVLGLLQTAVISTALCMLLQNIGQKYTPPSIAAILLSLEAVFGVLFSVLFYGEQLTGRLIVGFALIFVAVITSVTKLSFLRRKRTLPLRDTHQ